MPAFTFAASAGAVLSGLVPLGYGRITEDLDDRSGRVGSNLRLPEIGAVMLVSPFGIPQDFSEHIAICERHGRAVVIDNAAGLGSTRPNRGARPNVAEVFSMHATKPFGIGEGGAVFAHPRLEEPLRAAMNFSLNAPFDLTFLHGDSMERCQSSTLVLAWPKRSDSRPALLVVKRSRPDILLNCQTSAASRSSVIPGRRRGRSFQSSCRMERRGSGQSHTRCNRT